MFSYIFILFLPVNYEIISGNDLNLFVLDTGVDPPEVKTAQTIDPDEPASNPLSYSLLIHASDDRYFAPVTVVVDITLTNDHLPVFTQTTLTATVRIH